MVNVSRPDVPENGAAVLEADRQAAPGHPAPPARRDRASLCATLHVATGKDVPVMAAAVLGRLADRIGAAALR